MVSQSYTAVVERAQGLKGAFATEPYEAGWAHEAIIYLKVLRLTDGGHIAARVQISPDGIDWADEGTKLPVATQAGLYYVKVEKFGSWLRVAGEVKGAADSADVYVYIALKE